MDFCNSFSGNHNLAHILNQKMSPTSTMEKKKTLGRRKIEIKKIEKTSSRQVTFSKRRIGLFKKAAEFSIMTGAEVGIIVQSLGGHAVYSFGYPNVEHVLNRYTTTMVSTPETRPRPSGRLEQAMKEYEKVANALEAEKRRKKIFEETRRVKNADMWWNENVEGLQFEELEEYVSALERLKEKVMMRSDELMLLANTSMISTPSDLVDELFLDLEDIDCDMFLDQSQFV